MDYNQRIKLETELATEPEISVGDTIICKGIRATIAKLYYSFRCVEWHDERKEYVKYYDVEFKDTNDCHRHWKSYFDGGEIEYRKEV